MCQVMCPFCVLILDSFLLASNKAQKSLAKITFCIMFLIYADEDGDDHGIHQADMVQALSWWLYLGALCTATDVLHWAMCFVPPPPHLLTRLI